MKTMLRARSRSPMAVAVAAALIHAGATAQTAPATSTPPSNDTLQLDQVFVTGTTTGTSKMKQSVSVSTLGAVQIENSNATNAAEVLRQIPGVRSESSGGESNANITIRGLPISAGGSRYVQIQEDGLPLLQFGDMAFATPDTFLRIDSALDRLEVIRGGSASTLATNAPGGIINFITNTGEDKGGSISLREGLDYRQHRVDFNYGGPIAERTRVFIGGFFRKGEGTRNGDVNVEQGGQVRANITQEFDAGYVRLSLKHLDDHAPTYLPVPVRFNNGSISEYPGIDPRRASFYSPYLPSDLTLTSDNGHVASNINHGMQVRTDAVGAEGAIDLGGFKLSDKFRIARNSGRFIGIFPGDDPAPVPAGTRFATGPNRGNLYTGNAFTAVVFNTRLDDMGLTANDLKASRDFRLGADTVVTTSVGYYYSRQKVGLTWNFNQYLLEATGDKPSVLTSPINGTPGFGGCCSNTMDAAYRTSAPYGILALETGPFNIDGSVRRDKQTASGSFNQSTAGLVYRAATQNRIDYEVDHTSYSVGANYRLTKDLALFVRYSDGVSFNADRITFFNDPRLTNGSTSNIPINKVKQTEAGVKWRQDVVSTFVTFFHAKTDETNFDVTTQKASANSYDAKGVEVESALQLGGFRMGAGVTYTDAEIKASNNPALIGTTPKRQAKFVYQLSPTFSYGPATVGAAVVGTTKSMDDSPAGPISVKLAAYTVVNLFAKYQITSFLDASLGVNNVFDKIGYTESNDGRQAARSIDGRSARAQLRYTF